MKQLSSGNVAPKLWRLDSVTGVLTIVAASILYNLALLLVCWGFEDSGSVVLQLFNALTDVVQGSEGEKQFLITFLVLCIFLWIGAKTYLTKVFTKRVANSISYLNEEVSSLTANSSFISPDNAFRNTAWRADSSQPLSTAKIWKVTAYWATDCPPCLKFSSWPSASLPLMGWSKTLFISSEKRL